LIAQGEGCDDAKLASTGTDPAALTRTIYFRYTKADSRLKEEPLLFYCEFTWFPGTTREEVAQRLVEQHEAGANNPDRIMGWYNLAGGGAGFLIVNYDEITQLTAFLQPYMDLMSFDVRAINQLNYDERVNELRVIAGQRQA